MSLDTPSALVNALIAAEDHRFYAHAGVDFFAVVRAIVSCVQGRIQGASTIEQQLVRTITGRRDRTARRKLGECVIACYISANFSKDELACAYLRAAYFGFEVNGFKHAARYFGICVEEPTIIDACFLVAMLKRPYAKSKDIDELARRADWVRRRYLGGYVGHLG